MPPKIKPTDHSATAVPAGELEALLQDRDWRLNNLYYITDKSGHKILFRPNWAQAQLLDDLWYLNIILKARQLGFTTLLCIVFLDAALFTDNTQCGIIAHNRDDAEEFFNNKVKFAYDHLPDWLQKARALPTDSAKKLAFSNGSSIRVGTSLRSGTLQYLHISEFGKVCAQFPEKAREIVTGALNTVHAGQFIAIESTAEGNAGYFFDYCQDAIKMQQQGRKPSKMQFKFHFFPWWKEPGYSIDPDGITIPQELAKYFGELESGEQITLEAGQEAWYAEKWRTQRDDMTREYPGTPDEAFKSSVAGRYYQREMAKVRKDRRITVVPHTDGVPVNLSWDLGIDDQVAIWFHQRVRAENRIIDYLCGEDEGLLFYFRQLQALRESEGYIYGRIYLPHDATHRSLQTGKSVADQFSASGFTDYHIVPRTHDLLTSIEDTRRIFSSCWFDEVKTEEGVKTLDNYSKDPDRINGGFKARPRHDWASHGADSFRTLACGLDDVGPGVDVSGSKIGQTNKLKRRRNQGRSHMTA